MRFVTITVFLWVSLMSTSPSLSGRAVQPVVIAHRGLHLQAAQNSLSALREAIAAGTDYVEVDCRTTADGLVVDHHDSELPALGKIASLPYSRIKAEGPQGSARVPLFVEELAAGKGQMRFYVDMKEVTPAHLRWLLQQFDMVGDVVCYGDEEELAELQRLDPRVEVMPSIRPEAEMPGLVARLHPKYLESGWRGAPELAAVAHRFGARFFLDIVDDSPEYVLRCVRAGVDGLQTDDPPAVMRILEEAGLRRPRAVRKRAGGDPLDAARQAIAAGKTPLRANVHRTSDGLLACTLPHLGWPVGRIAWGQTPYAKLRGGYPGAPAVPLLGEVLAVARGKCPLALTLEEAAREQAGRLVREFGMGEQVTVHIRQ